MRDTAAVKVSAETWRRLNARKEPGDTFDDVVQDLLEQSDEAAPIEQ